MMLSTLKWASTVLERKSYAWIIVSGYFHCVCFIKKKSEFKQNRMTKIARNIVNMDVKINQNIAIHGRFSENDASENENVFPNQNDIIQIESGYLLWIKSIRRAFSWKWNDKSKKMKNIWCNWAHERMCLPKWDYKSAIHFCHHFCQMGSHSMQSNYRAHLFW